MVGDRILQMDGGYDKAVCLVCPKITGADPSRGERGTVTTIVTELFPRPILDQVTTEQIQRYASSVVFSPKSTGQLQLGDFQLELSGSQVTLKDLRNQDIYFTIEGERFNIVGHAMPLTVEGDVSRVSVFIRGAV